jgi:hypothetical protein
MADGIEGAVHELERCGWMQPLWSLYEFVAVDLWEQVGGGDGKRSVRDGWPDIGINLKNVNTRPEEAFKSPQEPTTRKLKKKRK